MRLYFKTSIYSIGYCTIPWFWRKAKYIEANPEGASKMSSWQQVSYTFYFQDKFTADSLVYTGAEKKKKSQGFGFHKHITSASLLFPYLRASWSPASRSCVARAGCAGAGSPHAHTVLPWAVSCKTEPTASYHSSAALARFETWGLLYSWPIVSPNGNNGLVHPPWNQWLKTIITALSLAGMPHGGVLIAHRKYENTLGTPQQLVIYCRALDDVRETTAERLSVLQLGGHLSFQ